MVTFYTINIIAMKFYNRKQELKDIHKILLREWTDFIYIYGRRRIWKTSLILKSVENEKKLYFFVWEKSEKELLSDFTFILKKELGLEYLNFLTFKDFLNFLFDYTKNTKLVVIFDEFQNFFNINKWLFSDFQYFWDLNKDNSKIKLFCLWSHFTLMKEIFENNKNPLFWRKTASFYLKSFDINTQIEILKDYDKLSEKNLLYFYSILYGIPKYIEIFFREIEQGSDKDFLVSFLDVFIKDNSFFIFEAKELFALEFWKSYDIYFSILTAISVWNTRKNTISDFTGISNDSLWFYLNKLENYFELIDRTIPITENSKSKTSRYIIKDLFLKFWFRYIYKYNYLLEIKDFESLKDIIKSDLNTFMWFTFERLIKEILIKENLENKLPFKFKKVWTYFDKKWFNEIDLVLLNSEEKKVMFIECKINKNKIDKIELKKLKQKVIDSGIYKSYKHYFAFASLENKDIGWDYFLSVKDFLNSHL